MNCWEILEICSTNDIALVKKAYASKLKYAKPDENPQAFCELHSAYKQALCIAREVEIHSSSEPNDENETSDLSDSQDRAVSVTVDHSLLVQQNTEQTDADLAQAWNDLASDVDQLLQDSVAVQDVARWSFIEGVEALIYIQFKMEFTLYLFGQIVAYTVEDSPHPLDLPADVVTYLNQIFHWTDQRRVLEDEFGYEEVDCILGKICLPQQNKKSGIFSLNKQVGPMVYANYYARLTASLLDFVLFALLFLVGEKILSSFVYVDLLYGVTSVSICVLLYGVGIALFEHSSLQASPGKLLFGLKVTCVAGRQLRFFHALLRSVIFILSTLLFSITIWINIFINDGRLLHDRCSRSVVIRR